MTTSRASLVLRTLPLLIAVCLVGSPAQAKYARGTGQPDDPYQIYTAEQMNTIGAEPNDWDKHFRLMADIDLDPNLPGRKVFDTAVIAPAFPADDYPYVKGTPFSGAFDGNGHVITHLTISGADYTGLFGYIDGDGRVENLRLLDVSVIGNRWVSGQVSVEQEKRQPR